MREGSSATLVMHPLLASARLYGILDTGYVAPEAMASMAQQLLQGGVQLLQLRAKKSSRAEIITMAQEILPVIRAHQALFFINDYPDLVPIVGADGAHIGQDDGNVAEARHAAGEGALIGLSTHSLEQVERACAQQPDYIGFGPLFTTATKPDYRPIGLADVVSAQRAVSFPLFCIGGITLERVPEVVEAGAERLVVVSDLLKAKDPAEQARKFLEYLHLPRRC